MGWGLDCYLGWLLIDEYIILYSICNFALLLLSCKVGRLRYANMDVTLENLE